MKDMVYMLDIARIARILCCDILVNYIFIQGMDRFLRKYNAELDLYVEVNTNLKLFFLLLTILFKFDFLNYNF